MGDRSAPFEGERRLDRLLAGMRPTLDPVRYAFCRQPDGFPAGSVAPLGTFRETEGVTLILDAEEAIRAGLAPDFLARRIELTVHSDLNAVGFLARISRALAAAGIPTNPVSAAWHDHLFVPEPMAERALQALLALEQDAARATRPAVYAVTLCIDGEIVEEWLEWMRTVHVPEVLHTGCFHHCTIQRDDGAARPDGRVTFVLEYLAASAARVELYQREYAPELQRAHSSRYAGRFEASRSVRTLVAELPESLA
jgi:hypothetical protein